MVAAGQWVDRKVPGRDMSTAELAECLRAHLANPTFIKDWEVDKRKCFGAARTALRKAAKDAKAVSAKGVRSGPTWVKAVDRLRTYLEDAGEADYDGLLGEALEACAINKGDEAQASEDMTMTVASLEAHLGRASIKNKPHERDYGAADAAARRVRTAHDSYLAALSAAQRMRTEYLETSAHLVGELEAIGEADFDGLLRQAISALKEPLPGAGQLQVDAPVGVAREGVDDEASAPAETKKVAVPAAGTSAPLAQRPPSPTKALNYAAAVAPAARDTPVDATTVASLPMDKLATLMAPSSPRDASPTSVSASLASPASPEPSPDRTKKKKRPPPPSFLPEYTGEDEGTPAAVEVA